MDSNELPSVEDLARYAANPAYTLTCRESRISWALGHALQNEDWERVKGYTTVRRALRMPA